MRFLLAISFVWLCVTGALFLTLGGAG